MLLMKKPSVAATPARKASAPAYKNPALPSARRTKDLLSRMTLEEKAAQMLCVWQEKAQKLVEKRATST
jgi:beta-glucosidase